MGVLVIKGIKPRYRHSRARSPRAGARNPSFPRLVSAATGRKQSPALKWPTTYRPKRTWASKHLGRKVSLVTQCPSALDESARLLDFPAAVPGQAIPACCAQPRRLPRRSSPPIRPPAPPRQWLHVRDRTVAVCCLMHIVMVVRIRGHLRQVSHTDHLMVLHETPHLLAQHGATAAADADFDLIEYEHRCFVGVGERGLQRKQRREASPPDAILASGFSGSPRFGLMRKATASMPVGPNCSARGPSSV